VDWSSVMLIHFVELVDKAQSLICQNHSTCL
jgi:hypothetical protein